MLLWIFVVIRNIFNYTNFTNFYSQKLARSYHFSANSRFCYKGLIIEQPFTTVILTIIISLSVFTFASWVYERPYHAAIGDEILNNWFNGLYFITMTMSTVAYGDIIPYSWYGKVISMILAFYGSFVVSLFIVVT